MDQDRSAGRDAPTRAERRSVFARARALVASLLAKDAADDSPASEPDPVAPSPPPKTVGVLTLPLHTNYGGNLQAYALFETLKDLGYRPVLINRRHRPSPQVEVPPPAGAKGRMVSAYSLKKREPSYAFIDSRLGPFTGQFLSTEDLRDGIGAYDFHAVIVGSDQVWRPKYATTMLSDYFLNFLPDAVGGPLRISYAASLGADRWEYTAEQTDTARRLLARFDAVSVREDGAVDLCGRHLGVQARHVLDPTLLLCADRYRPLFALRPERTAEARVLAYVLNEREITGHVVGALAAALGMPAHATDGRRFGDAAAGESEGDTSVEAWLTAFADARFVVTDSFHGVAFAILFNKPFVAIGNRARGLARFTSLLRQVGLEDRLVMTAAGLDVPAMLRPIDWSAVNERLDELRGDSLAFLRAALAAERTPAAAAPAPRPVERVADDAEYRNPLGVLCSGCGACVSESAGTLRMAWNTDGFLVPQATSGEAVPATVVRVCPFNPAPEPAVADEDALANLFLPAASQVSPRAGRFETAYIGYSRTFRPTSSSGGIATYVFEQLLRRGDVDALFVVGGDADGGYRYQMLDDPDRVAEQSKTRYYPVTLEELFAIIEERGGRVAVSGVACFAKAIRLKQFYHPELRDRIPFVVGIVCGGLKSRNYSRFLAQSAGIEGDFSDADYRVKNLDSTALDYSFAATDDRSRRRSVRMRRLGDMWGTGLFKARACDFCSDVLTELADISLGDAWLPEYKADGMGNSIVVTRTPLAEEIMRAGIASGELAVAETPIARIIQSQGGGFNHKQTALGFRKWVAGRFSDIPVPALRARLLAPAPASLALVQIHRERTRAKSLLAWRRTGSADGVVRRMRSSLSRLKAATEARREAGGGALAVALASGRVDRVRTVAAAPGQERGVARWLLNRLAEQRPDPTELTEAIEAHGGRGGRP